MPGITAATLPDNRVMRQNVEYVINSEDYIRLGDGSKTNVIELVDANPANTVVPLWNGSSAYALDLVDINDKANINDVRIVDGNLAAEAEKTFKLGEVVTGFGDDLFMLVLLDDTTGGAANAVAGVNSVAAWLDRENHVVTVDPNPIYNSFAGVFVDDVDMGNYGWIQYSGIIPGVPIDDQVIQTEDNVTL